MQRKKSRFWSFIWSLVPGAGEMYLGFMKMGVSLMLGFMLLIAIAVLTNIGALAVFPLAMWFYSFFHANNLAGLDDQRFMMMEDKLLFGLDEWEGMEQFGEKLSSQRKRAIATVLIILGVLMLWQAVFNLLCDIFGWDNAILRQIYFFVRDYLPRFVVGAAIIWAGIVMIRGKKIESGNPADIFIEAVKQPEYHADRQPDPYMGADRQPERYAEPGGQPEQYLETVQQHNQ